LSLLLLSSLRKNIMRTIRTTISSIVPLRSGGTGAGIAALALIAIGFLWHVSGRTGEPAKPLPPPQIDSQRPAGSGLETAVLAGGCFWGVQGVYQHTKGVMQVVSGYAGGDRERSHYEQVGTGQTGHAESVQITFDPREISYGEILRIYFSVAHDPTQLNRQGPDSGSQYRSAIFYADASQQRVAQAYVAQLEQAHVFAKPIVTRIDPLKAFFPAEAYHQDFLIRHPDHPYILVNDLPKIENLKRLLPQDYREQPVMTSQN
jgi:peptide-methionine (S)-S-oxide reductase